MQTRIANGTNTGVSITPVNIGAVNPVPKLLQKKIISIPTENIKPLTIKAAKPLNKRYPSLFESVIGTYILSPHITYQILISKYIIP
jgi:hypothetical protein